MNVLVYFNLLAFHIIVAAENDDSPKIVQGPVDKKVLENSVVSFFCKATGHPPPDISWHRGGKKIGASHTRYTNINMPQGSVLRIDSVKSRRDDVSFECVAHNSNGETAKASAELEVYSEGNVPYGFPRIVENPTLKVVEKNRTVKLICSATGNPDPSITWLKDFIPVDTSDPRFQILSTGTLQIQNSLESDEGKYECVAENSVGVAYSYHANLYVRASLPGPTNVHVERMSPTSIEVTWDPPSFSGIVGYSIFYHTVSTADMESWKSIETGLNTDLEIEGLEPHTVYVVRVRARASGGRQSNFSDIVFTNETEHAMGVEPTFDSSQANVTIVSGGIALLPCSIENLGKYRVAWLDRKSIPVFYQDQRVIDDSRFSIVRNTTNDWHLEIRDVDEYDRGPYRCAINTFPFKSKLINLFVEALSVEPSFNSSQTNVTVVSGGIALLPCTIENLREYRVAWLDANSFLVSFDDRRVIDDSRFSIVRDTTNDWHLEIRGVREDDRGEYRCTINTFPVKSKLINLFVKALSVEPTFNSSQANVTVMSGGIALLPCSIENLGKYRVAWLDVNSFPVSFDDRRVIDDSRFSIVRKTTKDWHLEIRDVREDDRGEYRCTINTHPAKSKLINLFVEVLDVEPTFDSSQTNVTVVSGGLALLPCSIEKLGKHRVAWLDASSIALCFDDRTIIEDPRFSIVRNTTKDWHLEIRDVRKEDQGQYRCTINTFPVTSKLINLFVEAPIDSPEYVRTTSDTTLILMLYPVSKFYGPVSHYYLFVIDDEMTENMSPDDFQLDDFLTDDGRSAGQWIAAQFDGMVPSEFELGRHSEGVKENTSIQNRPLKLDQTYRVFLRVYTPDNKSTSSPFSQPLSTISGPREHLPFLNESLLPPVYIIALICAAVVLVLLVVLIIIFTRKGRFSKNDMMNNPSIPDSELKDLIDQLEANEGVSQD